MFLPKRRPEIPPKEEKNLSAPPTGDGVRYAQPKKTNAAASEPLL